MREEITGRWLRTFDEVGLDDVGLVGGKTAALGELRHALSEHAAVPDGFAITATAFREIITTNGLAGDMAKILAETDWSNSADGADASRRLRVMVEAADWPDGLSAAVAAAYRRLGGGRAVPVAVRSSATAEDLPGASFAGLHDSFLNICGEQPLEAAVRRCLSSLFTERAISYRNTKGFAHDKVALSVAVQLMVDASAGASGVIFTLDTESGCRDVVMVTGVLGLGETIVQGIADPDEFLVHKTTFNKGFRAVLRHRIGAKQVRMVRERGGVRTISPRLAARHAACLDDAEILSLAGKAIAIEAHYSRRAGKDTPMDIEWAKDGRSGRLYIIQARPETVHGGAVEAEALRYRLQGDGPIIATGQAVGERIAAGTVRIVQDAHGLETVRPGDVLVAQTTSPDWEPVMRRAAAIVTEHGGRTCHAAIIARELGIPAIVGVAGARMKLADGDIVTVCCGEGETGRIRQGRLPFVAEPIAIRGDRPDRPRILVNVADPAKAFRTAALPVDGVGLARIEFIITQSIGVHPMALVAPERIADAVVRRKIAALTSGYRDGADFFEQRLAEGVGVIAAAFYPRPVVVRTSDFKTNEYRALLGGADFERTEDNPMIGFRGASRYVHPDYGPAFALECRALARVRNEMGLDNVIVMIPFCRRVSEGRRVLAAMAENGLVRSSVNGLKIYAMAEIPSNALSVDAFAELFDGFSIGSNDLTQLTLGVDRDSAILAADFDEQDPAVLRLIEEVIAGAHRHGLSCGLCGQGPSDKPAFADWLVAKGIDSISLNPDSVPGFLARGFEAAGSVPIEAAEASQAPAARLIPVHQ
ncbi:MULTISPECIES: phosphoenolpyruvate synthase [unclassified Sphingomonas]|uniref:phosphoenolpyruvate synthase n=1 Tax=unclassified Sphingomonas TaxID=196159 RepID=UPI0006FAFB26|nr:MULTISPECIES: phosphoenolpyruvate synthase [unclassified Sphingomonas]KQX20058.1 phosphoenolpyruvate synthase [Sphingomonas sp. Root1294]KQY67308.1 phosphoenolpyruvate synthase [Sphingomonas sp. Root50]KRB90683.1 phosphoenolpyruvate synthase [Sphingomonas sp. Root720]